MRDNHYLVKPKPELEAMLQYYLDPEDETMVYVLLEPVILFERGGYLTHKSDPNFNVHSRVKFAFLIHLLEGYADLTDPVFRRILRELIGEPPYHIQVFDRWWEIIEVTYDLIDVNKDTILDGVEDDILSQFATTDSSLEERFVRDLIERRNSEH